MTRPIYSQTTLEALSTKELKTIASQIGAISDGDKRVKQTWISAIIDHQTKFSPVKVAAMSAHIATVMSRLEPIPADETDNYEAIDTYVPTPPTRSDDEAFAAAMGLTYDDVFGESIEPIQPIEKPIEELLIQPIELPTDEPMEEPRLVEPSPTLIPVLSIAIVLLCSIAIFPALVLVSIVVTLGQTQRGTTPQPQPIGSMS
jgi:hypothetical protein